MDPPQVKRSHGLAQFVESIQDSSGLTIFDAGRISQQNVSFLTSLGHRLYSEDLLGALDEMTHAGDAPGGPIHPDRIQAFLDHTLDFPMDRFDGALIWDALQFLSRPLLHATVERLHRILRPGAYLFALFQADERPAEIPVYSYRIQDHQSLHLMPRGRRTPAQSFNNRGIEQLFARFEAVKFFLTRDHLREVIVKR
ncbi:MAG: class I SAM-dependent methyltransferase [bacterium]|nr:class I SAM-dependent methyltransferase [bacterium]